MVYLQDKNHFILLTAEALLVPPPGGEQSVSVPRLARLDSPWVALICMHAASPTEHSSQAREVGGKRGKQNLIFMVN